MTRNIRTIVSWVLLPFALSACQTTGTSKWVSKTETENKAAAVSDATSHDAVIGVNDVGFEIGNNPYAYKSIPPGVRPAADTAEAGFWYQIDKMENAAQTAGNRINDEKINQYLTEIACRLAGPYCNDTRVYVQRIPLFNATMAPNGMMSIFSGFLLRTQNEAQIAAVVGHEIGHYIRRHTIQRFEDQRAKADFMQGLSMFMGAAGIPVVADIASLAILSAQFSFGRDHEREADLIGINLMAKYGYDTREASNVWRQLLREEDPDLEEDEISTSTSFAATHPSSGERLKTLAAIADKLQGPDRWGSKGKERFDSIVGPWKFQFLQDEVRLRQWKSTLSLLDILAENGHDKAEIHYFRGEVFRQRDRDAKKTAEQEEDKRPDSERAREQYEKSIFTNEAPAQAYRALGLMQHKANENSAARKNLLKYLELMPDATDANMIRFVLGSMTGPNT